MINGYYWRLPGEEWRPTDNTDPRRFYAVAKVVGEIHVWPIFACDFDLPMDQTWAMVNEEGPGGFKGICKLGVLFEA